MNDDNIDELSLMFEASRSLIAGAKIVITSKGIEDRGLISHPTLPVIVCSGLAIEIQLKLILKLCESAWPKREGHDLYLLFEALPSVIQTEILEHQSLATALPVNEIRSRLNSEKDVFKTWRYPYEKPLLETFPAFLVDFAIALSDYIVTKTPIERSGNGWLSGGTFQKLASHAG